MPVYEYECHTCDYITDVFRRIDERDHAQPCHQCGKKTNRKISLFTLLGSPAGRSNFQKPTSTGVRINGLGTSGCSGAGIRIGPGCRDVQITDCSMENGRAAVSIAKSSLSEVKMKGLKAKKVKTGIEITDD